MKIQDIEVMIVSDADKFLDVQRLHQMIWGLEDIEVTPLHILIATQKANGLVLCAYFNEKPVGFSFSFLAQDDSTKQSYLYSHNVGVDPNYQGHGIGYALKLKQREIMLQRDIERISWTFDPLESRNAYFNFVKLGCISHQYICNYWGTMHDELNSGIASDRLIVDWFIASDRVEQHLTGKPRIELQRELILNPQQYSNVNNLSHVPDDPENLPLANNSSMCFVEIPANYQQIRRNSVEVAIAWRAHTRKIFLKCFELGFSVNSFVHTDDNRSYYFLSK